MFQSKLLLEQSGILHGMSEMSDGSQSFRYTNRLPDARGNRMNFLSSLNEATMSKLFMLGNGVSMRPAFDPPIEPERQIQVVGFSDRGKGMFLVEEEIAAEALVTRDRGMFLFLTTADCLPVALFDPVAGVLALAHVSRVTASYLRSPGAGEMAERTPPLLSRLVDFLAERFMVRPGNLLAAIGPGIGQHSYALQWFMNGHEPEWQPFLIQRAGKIHPDLAGFSRWLLVSKGLWPAHIEVAGVDTVSARGETDQFRFFSHARALQSREVEGRNAFAVGMPK